jgi:translation initiation factor 1
MTKLEHKRSHTVYSTNPNFEAESQSSDETNRLPPTKQNLKVGLDKKQRGGKTVTLITGFVGASDDLNELARTLKTKCGVGGSVKDGAILIQGDVREKVIAILSAAGFRVKKAGG